jgi:riboflavin synthase
MFTGIVREVGTVAAFDGSRLVVSGAETAASSAVGDSVSVAGVCLTVVEREAGSLAFDVVPETLARTGLGGVQPGDAVNLEPALRVGDPLGGHVVQGHVDGVGEVVAVGDEGFSRRVWIEPPPELLRYVVQKGSIAVAGVSLTVAEVTDDRFAVALIPETLERTTLGTAAPGDRINIEVDVLAKHVEKLLEGARA